MKVGDLVKCALFEKKGVITDTYDLSTPSSRMEVIKLSWEDGKEETVNVTRYPERLKKLSDNEEKKVRDDAFGRDIAEP